MDEPRSHRGTEKYFFEDLTRAIIGAAVEVHRVIGPGLLESIYEECLCYELSERKLAFARQVRVPLVYKGLMFERHSRIDLIVEDAVVVEVKSVRHLEGIHEAQLLTYLRLTERRVGLILNFNTRVLKNGIIRRVL